MRACLAPYRLAIFHMNIVQRTLLGTLSAGNTRFLDIKFLCMHKHRIECIVDKAAAQAIPPTNRWLREVLAEPNHVRRFGNFAFCPAKKHQRFFLCRRGKQGDIVFRHNDGITTAKIHMFGNTQRFQRFFRIADIVAAGHDKINRMASFQRRVFQPLMQDAGNPPRVGRAYHDPRTARLQRSGIFITDPSKYVYGFLLQQLAELPCHICTVAGA